MRWLAPAAAGAIFLLPLVAGAGVRVCTPPEVPLRRGDKGDAVANLQIYLARERSVYPEAAVTGFFGPATERALGRWQVLRGVVPEGTNAAGGLGRVGPKTIAALKMKWNCAGPLSVGWFGATVFGGSARFSGQASSTYPLDPALLAVDFGDGARAKVSVSSAVCDAPGGPCSSVISAAHSYAAGSFTASLFGFTPHDGCPDLSSAGCQRAASARMLGAVTISSDGIPAASPADLRAASSSASVSASMSYAGGTLTIRWTSTSTPSGTSAELALYDADGRAVGIIARALPAAGSYAWKVPRAPGTCAGSAFDCLAQASSSSCAGGICPLERGTYSVVVRVRDTSGAALAAARAGRFALGGGSSASSPVASTVGVDFAGAFGSSGAYGSSGKAGSSGAHSSLPAGGAAAARSCMYSGIEYGSGITLSLNCSDFASQACASFAGQALTCKNGSWINASGTPVSVPSAAPRPAPSSGSCRTPWGGQIVQSGNQITYEPFFTAGNYSGIKVMPLMQCTSGAWQKCDWMGANCQAYLL